MKEPLEERMLEAAEKGLKIRVPVKALVIDNVREYPEEAVKARAASISAVGLLVAIIINTKGIVFDGAGRLLAAMMLGWSEIDAMVIKTDLTPSEWKIRQLTTSIHREKLTDWELFENCMTIGMRTEWKQVELAKYLAVDEPTICRWLSPSKTTEKCRDALKAGLISFTHTMRLARIPYEEQDLVLDGILSGTISSREELDLFVRERTKRPSKNGQKTEVKRFKATLPDSAVSVALSGKSLGIAEVIEALAELLKLARKAEKDRLDVTTFERVLRDQGNDRQKGNEAA